MSLSQNDWAKNSCIFVKFFLLDECKWLIWLDYQASWGRTRCGLCKPMTPMMEAASLLRRDGRTVRLAACFLRAHKVQHVSHARNIDHTWILLFFGVPCCFFSLVTLEQPNDHLECTCRMWRTRMENMRTLAGWMSPKRNSRHTDWSSQFTWCPRGVAPWRIEKTGAKCFALEVQIASMLLCKYMKINALSGTHCQGMIGNKAFLNCHLCKPDWSHWSYCNNVSVGSSNFNLNSVLFSKHSMAHGAGNLAILLHFRFLDIWRMCLRHAHLRWLPIVAARQHCSCRALWHMVTSATLENRSRYCQRQWLRTNHMGKSWKQKRAFVFF